MHVHNQWKPPQDAADDARCNTVLKTFLCNRTLEAWGGTSMIVYRCKDNNVIYQRTMFIVQVSYRGIVMGAIKTQNRQTYVAT